MKTKPEWRIIDAIARYLSGAYRDDLAESTGLVDLPWTTTTTLHPGNGCFRRSREVGYRMAGGRGGLGNPEWSSAFARYIFAATNSLPEPEFRFDFQMMTKALAYLRGRRPDWYEVVTATTIEGVETHALAIEHATNERTIQRMRAKGILVLYNVICWLREHGNDRTPDPRFELGSQEGSMRALAALVSEDTRIDAAKVIQNLRRRGRPPAQAGDQAAAASA